MGRQAKVLTKLDGHTSTADARLEFDILHLRADQRVSVKFSEIKRCVENDGWLSIEFGTRHLDLHLGTSAVVWKNAIESPPSLAQKLGVKSDLSVLAVGFDDLTFLGDVNCATAFAFGDLHDLVLFNAQCVDCLKSIPNARKATAPRGGMWVVYPRGNKELPEKMIRAHCSCDGWVDVKTCRFDDTRTALKFVRRLS